MDEQQSGIMAAWSDPVLRYTWLIVVGAVVALVILDRLID